MKSKFEKIDEEQLDGDNDPENSKDQYDPDAGETVEVDNSGPDVGNNKGSKLIVLVASAILITIVLYFFFFRGGKTNKVEKIQEVTTEAPAQAEAPAKAENIGDFASEDYILQKPKEPDLPKLPDLPKDPNNPGFDGVLPSFIDLPKGDASKAGPAQVNPNPQQQNPPSIPVNPAANNGMVLPINAPSPVLSQPVPAVNQVHPPLDPRKSPIIVVGGDSKDGGKSDAGLPLPAVGYENNIIQLNPNGIDQLKKTNTQVTPTIVEDMPNTIVQGKILTAVLETAISTELPGAVRAIVSRDVYAEAGNNILIPKGSRLYGSYSSAITRGQARVQIGWTRLIRPDGVDMNITFNASDQFGRSGIDGDVDNKYGLLIGNSILTSILTVGGAIAAEKLSGGHQTSTTTTDALGNVTATGQASNKLIYDASKAIIDTVGQAAGNYLGSTPVIRVPQGTRITIIANADITLPNMRKTTKSYSNE